ncbi:hypothetical protein EDD37DRAFT_650076 [Exophiala viscosa]|uniref:UTP23 sensor motif region domain-containing protein n=1 Tax=Exophiala viscosa TaxID=2486360 RepID=A0AAN6E1I3_9EURO|nr:hypothetical protein EDD36DRAFT_462441 [Exophiala viscosa]KAI1624190.1 hypothetical protein EDD37DRAFT_650076 [Exophiala viscosa]
MRAKRSKKYRKIMQSYQLAFGFREPYQVLLDSNFLRTAHAFHMPLQKYLENTLHGECRLFVTKCSLAKVMADFEKDPNKHPRQKRPGFLPPPTEVPLRHCKHKNEAGEEVVFDEARCLLDLLAGQPHGNEQAKNKQHYILASADAEDNERRRRGYIDVRERARTISGVPIVYVKRSVMILEEFSGASEGVRRRGEKEKFSEGLIGLDRKRKRGDREGDSEDEDLALEDGNTGPKVRGAVRAKGPNPLSVRKKKVKTTQDGQQDGKEGEQAKRKRRRRGKNTGESVQADGAAAVD